MRCIINRPETPFLTRFSCTFHLAYISIAIQSKAFITKFYFPLLSRPVSFKVDLNSIKSKHWWLCSLIISYQNKSHSLKKVVQDLSPTISFLISVAINVGPTSLYGEYSILYILRFMEQEILIVKFVIVFMLLCMRIVYSTIYHIFVCWCVRMLAVQFHLFASWCRNQKIHKEVKRCQDGNNSKNTNQ